MTRDSPIDRVINRLIDIIDWAERRSSRVGYFAGLYLRVTQTIRAKIGTGYFDDDARMERLDAAFAGRYFEALEQYRSDDPALPKAWAAAFHAIDHPNLIVVQHLLLAMNPHINIDLGAAAAEIVGDRIRDLRDDFMKINAILASLVPVVIDEMGKISPLIHLVDDLAKDKEEAVINFSMNVARDFAWQLAKRLAGKSKEERQEVIDRKNRVIAKLSRKIIDPGPLTEFVLKIVETFESKNVVKNIKVLNTGNPLPDLVRTAESVAGWKGEGPPPNQVYYFQIADGSWRGTFHFQVTHWGRLWRAGMGLKNKFLVWSMAVFQRLFGDGRITSVIEVFPEKGTAGVVHNSFHIYKSWFTLFRSEEDYILSPNGTGVTVDAHVRFGPFPFLFREHDVYPAAIYDGGMRALYLIDLLGTRFLGKYTVRENRKQVHSVLENDFATAVEILDKDA